MSRYVLYGIRPELESLGIGEGYREVDTKEAVATFDSQELAEAYVEASKKRSWKAYVSSYRYEEINKQFKKSSLLSYYAYTEIELEEELPHNPSI